MNKTLVSLLALSSIYLSLGTAHADYARSCTGGVWVTYFEDSYHYYEAGWLNGSTAVATAYSRHYRPNTLRGKARDRFRFDCFQNLRCSGEQDVGGYRTDITRPWPYPTTQEEILEQAANFACEHAKRNFRDIRQVGTQLRITGNTNCGLSDRRSLAVPFLSRGAHAGEVICRGRYPR